MALRPELADVVRVVQAAVRTRAHRADVAVQPGADVSGGVAAAGCAAGRGVAAEDLHVLPPVGDRGVAVVRRVVRLGAGADVVAHEDVEEQVVVHAEAAVFPRVVAEAKPGRVVHPVESELSVRRRASAIDRFGVDDGQPRLRDAIELGDVVLAPQHPDGAAARVRDPVAPHRHVVRPRSVKVERAGERVPRMGDVVVGDRVVVAVRARERRALAEVDRVVLEARRREHRVPPLPLLGPDPRARDDHLVLPANRPAHQALADRARVGVAGPDGVKLGDVPAEGAARGGGVAKVAPTDSGAPRVERHHGGGEEAEPVEREPVAVAEGEGVRLHLTEDGHFADAARRQRRRQPHQQVALGIANPLARRVEGSDAAVDEVARPPPAVDVGAIPPAQNVGVGLVVEGARPRRVVRHRVPPRHPVLVVHDDVAAVERHARRRQALVPNLALRRLRRPLVDGDAARRPCRLARPAAVARPRVVGPCQCIRPARGRERRAVDEELPHLVAIRRGRAVVHAVRIALRLPPGELHRPVDRHLGSRRARRPGRLRRERDGEVVHAVHQGAAVRRVRRTFVVCPRRDQARAAGCITRRPAGRGRRSQPRYAAANGKERRARVAACPAVVAARRDVANEARHVADGARPRFASRGHVRRVTCSSGTMGSRDRRAPRANFHFVVIICHDS